MEIGGSTQQCRRAPMVVSILDRRYMVFSWTSGRAPTVVSTLHFEIDDLWSTMRVIIGLL